MQELLHLFYKSNQNESDGIYIGTYKLVYYY